ncbi:MEDS domain-containing protein [Lentzea sp. HUAS12]|uniref:MEDS domain-containing protein n=1 Tax=Lentzea sp. HUAS12 TaxID=2951806 RepID=UPI00209EEC8F|nr:MEDS domain-containing protein [Lentzea sp. HUAS12]USX53798.1 MEDS domain-containing protein [Lentzea sp. HUAS12]
MTVAVFDGVPLDVHSHLCVFHHGPAERDELLMPFLSDGLRRGEACQYFAMAGDRDDAERKLGGPHPRLQVNDAESRYRCDDGMDSDAFMAELDEWSGEQENPCRVAGDMRWAGSSLSRPGQLDALFRHEVNASRWVTTRPVYALCFYDLDLFDGDVIVPMVNAHPQIWMTGVLLDNPYHQQPLP